jgi:DMSO reductase anchor subunit
MALLGRLRRRALMPRSALGARFEAADHLCESPIRGISAFNSGTLVGVTFGLIAATGWIVALYRNRTNSRWKWWQWTTAILWIIAIITTHRKYGPQPAVTNSYMFGTLWYEIMAFLGAAASLAAILVRQRSGSQPRDGK